MNSLRIPLWLLLLRRRKALKVKRTVKGRAKESRNCYSKSDYRNKLNIFATWRFDAFAVTYISHKSFKMLRKGCLCISV
jgi:hypothetical protein